MFKYWQIEVANSINFYIRLKMRYMSILLAITFYISYRSSMDSTTLTFVGMMTLIGIIQFLFPTKIIKQTYGKIIFLLAVIAIIFSKLSYDFGKKRAIESQSIGSR